jgi:hypothetical protein
LFVHFQHTFRRNPLLPCKFETNIPVKNVVRVLYFHVFSVNALLLCEIEKKSKLEKFYCMLGNLNDYHKKYELIGIFNLWILNHLWKLYIQAFKQQIKYFPIYSNCTIVKGMLRDGDFSFFFFLSLEFAFPFSSGVSLTFLLLLFSRQFFLIHRIDRISDKPSGQTGDTNGSIFFRMVHRISGLTVSIIIKKTALITRNVLGLYSIFVMWKNACKSLENRTF